MTQTDSVPAGRVPGAPGEQVPTAEIRQICTFSLSGERFGIDILQVQEVAIVPELGPAFHTPPCVAGVVNIRGQIKLCLDLRSFFDLEPGRLTAESRLILFKETVGEDFGILVDCVDDILEIPETSIENCLNEPTDSAEGQGEVDTSHLVCGISKFEEELLLIIKPGALLAELDRDFARHCSGSASR